MDFTVLRKNKALIIMFAAVFAAVIIVACAIYGIFFHKTEEEKILELFERYEESFNSGDLDDFLECIDAQSRQMYEGMYDLGSGALSSLIGFDIPDFDTLFGFSPAVTGATIDVKVLSVKVISDESARARIRMTYSDRTGVQDETITGTVMLVTEDGEWRICDSPA